MREQLRIKPYDRTKRYAKRTPAQEAAARRTWVIINLRSIWVLAFRIRTPWRLWIVRWCIDGELRRLKAEPHGIRAKRERAEFEKELADHRRDRSEPIPF